MSTATLCIIYRPYVFRNPRLKCSWPHIWHIGENLLLRNLNSLSPWLGPFMTLFIHYTRLCFKRTLSSPRYSDVTWSLWEPCGHRNSKVQVSYPLSLEYNGHRLSNCLLSNRNLFLSLKRQFFIVFFLPSVPSL